MGPAQALDTDPGHTSVGHYVLSMTRRAWSAYWTRRAEHATIAILHSLNDRALKDIGLDRSEIESVVHGARDDRRRGHRQSPAAASARSAERRIAMCL